MTTISKKLKELRKLSGFSVQNVCEYLNANGIDISENTMYSYESGHRMLNADVFLLLCAYYNCKDVLYEFGYSDKKLQDTLSNEDTLILEKYNQLFPEGKEMIHGALGVTLNDEAKKKNEKLA